MGRNDMSYRGGESWDFVQFKCLSGDVFIYVPDVIAVVDGFTGNEDKAFYEPRLEEGKTICTIYCEGDREFVVMCSALEAAMVMGLEIKKWVPVGKKKGCKSGD